MFCNFVFMKTSENKNIVSEPVVSYGVSQPTDITDISMLDMSKVYTYANYLTWRFKERIEIIKGKIFKMSPAPARKHQDISAKLFVKIGSYLENKSCKYYSAPFDVRFPNGNNDNDPFTVVQPDICIVCDHSKLDDKGCNGAPDFIVEILSPSTAAKDIQDKFELYEENGVKEYWIVDPENKILDIFTLKSGKYVLVSKYNEEQNVSPVLFPDLIIELGKIFNQ